MSRQNTDQLYIELDYYYPEEYYVYTAEAQCAASAESTMVCEIGKISSAEIALVSEFTQTATISHIEGADLFAFSEAAIAAQVDRIRDNNIEAAAAFDVAVDFVRFRDIDSAEESVFTITSEITRSRLATINAEAAFSFSCDGAIIAPPVTFEAALSSTVSISADIAVQRSASSEQTVTATQSADAERIRLSTAALESSVDISISANRIQQVSAALTSAATISIDVEKTVDYQASISSNFSQTTINDRIRDNSSAISSQSTLSAIISHIEGADIVVQGFAEINIDANVISGAVASIQSAFTQQTVISKAYSVTASLAAVASILVSRNVGTGRPWNMTVSSYSTNRKFGTYSALGAIATTNSNFNAYAEKFDPWVLEGFISFTSYSAPTVEREIIKLGPVSIRQRSTGVLRVLVTNSDDQLIDLGASGATAFSNAGQNHFLLVKNDVAELGHMAFYWNGTRVWRSSSSQQEWKKESSLKLEFFNPTGWATRIDEVRYSLGTQRGYSPGSSSITVPTQAYTNDEFTQGLWHFENTGADDVSLVQTAAANISSIASISASISGPVLASANLSSQFTQTVIGSVLGEINLEAFSDAALSADILKIKQLEADTSIDTALSADVDLIKDISADLNLETALSLPVTERLLVADITTESIASQVSIAVKVGSVIVDCAVIAEQTVTANRYASAISNISSEFAFAVDGIKAVEAEADISAATTLSSPVERIIQAASNQNSSVLFAARGNQIADNLVNINSTFSLDSSATATIFSAALLASSGTLATVAGVIRGNEIDQSSEFTLAADTANSYVKGVNVALASTASQSISANRIRDNSINASAQFNTLFNIQNVKSFEAHIDGVFGNSVLAVKAATGLVEIVTTASINVVATKSVVAAANITSETDISIEPITGLIGFADFESQFVQTTNANVDAIASADLTATFGISLDIERTRPFASLVMSMGEVVADIDRIRIANSTMQTTVQVSATVGKLVEVECNVGSLFTPSVTLRKIFTNVYVYRIPREIRSYRVSAETREYVIPEETRIYTIRR